MQSFMSVSLACAAFAGLAGESRGCEFPTYSGLARFNVQSESRPVVVDADCSMTNVGLLDDIALGPAFDAGQGRVYQIHKSDPGAEGFPSSMFVTDCNALLVTYLEGPIDEDFPETTCGPRYRLHTALTGPNGIVTLGEGKDLYGLEAAVLAAGGRTRNPNEVFNTTPWGDPVWRRDRVNFTCGCRLFYPDSPGAD